MKEDWHRIYGAQSYVIRRTAMYEKLPHQHGANNNPKCDRRMLEINFVTFWNVHLKYEKYNVPRRDVIQSSTNISEENAASIFSWERSEVYTSERNDSNRETELANWMSGHKKGLFFVHETKGEGNLFLWTPGRRVGRILTLAPNGNEWSVLSEPKNRLSQQHRPDLTLLVFTVLHGAKSQVRMFPISWA
jgi:hypothetical protein